MEGPIKGVPVIFLLDTSRSMRGEGFAQMKEAFLSMIQGQHLCLLIVCNDIIVITCTYNFVDLMSANVLITPQICYSS